MTNRQNMLKTRGVILQSGKNRHFLIDLYCLDDFFVELWYSPNSVGINQIRSFKDIKQLEPYLKKHRHFQHRDFQLRRQIPGGT